MRTSFSLLPAGAEPDLLAEKILGVEMTDVGGGGVADLRVVAEEQTREEAEVAAVHGEQRAETLDGGEDERALSARERCVHEHWKRNKAEPFC